jgi:hypothetical protein
MDFVVDGSELHSIMVALNRRGMLTVGDGFHNYVYPSVHNMEIKMDVVLFKGNNFTDIRERIKNIVYKYLKENTEFGTPIYRSKIASLVHSMKEVAGVDVYFQPADSAFTDIDLASYGWMEDSTATFCNWGTAQFSGMNYTLRVVRNGAESYVECAMRDQGTIQKTISEYYRVYIAPYVNSTVSPITDKLIDRFVAFVWDKVMQEIYYPVAELLGNAYDTGGDALYYKDILQSIKTWDMGKDSLTFKGYDKVKELSEINGSVLFDYMRYAMDYVKLIRRVLCAKSTASLINKETGNITEYSNDNEIVQFNIPNELIELSVAQASSLLTGTGNS